MTTSGTADVAITQDHSFEDLVSDVRGLSDLAKKLRTQRFANGALSLGDVSLRFKLDETDLPIDCGLNERLEACELVEEVRTRYNFCFPIIS
jgi:protein SSD1